MEIVHIGEASGMVLGQDLTRIDDNGKGIAFRKGHILRDEDIPFLLDMGKEHVYVMRIPEDAVHENEAAQQLAGRVAGTQLLAEEPGEGKVNVKAATTGVLKIDIRRLTRLNRVEGIAVSTLHDGTVVQAGQLVASVKIIPLLLPEQHLAQGMALCGSKGLITLQPLPMRKVGLVITGGEVFHGRIPDRFEAVLRSKLEDLGSGITRVIVVPDHAEQIADAIRELAADNELVVVTGGMSVDPDDVTPEAIRRTGAKIAVYGTPVLPGAMFMAAYLGKKAVLGLPACGMFSKITILDVLLPKVLLGKKITAAYVAALGHGGLCQSCAEGCRYPHCAFCK